MTGLPFDGGSEWSTGEKIDNLGRAGFEGIDVAWTPTLPAAETVECAQAAGLDWRSRRTAIDERSSHPL
jgi:hypothetical protein